MEKIKTMRFVHSTIHGFSDVLGKDGMQNTPPAFLAVSDENCCLQKTKSAGNPAPKPASMFGNDEILKEQEVAARVAKVQRGGEEKKRRGKERQEREEKKRRKKGGPSWFEKTFNKLPNEIFSDDDIK